MTCNFRTLFALSIAWALLGSQVAWPQPAAAPQPLPTTAATASPAEKTEASEAPPPAAADAPVASAEVAAPSKAGAESAEGDDDRNLLKDQLLVLEPKTKENLEQRLKALDSAGLSDDDKAKAGVFYQQAIEAFNLAVQQLVAAEGFEKEFKALPEKTASYAERLAKQLPPQVDISGEPLAAVEKRASNAETSLAECRQQLALVVAEPKRRAQRLSEMPKQIADAQQRLKDLTEQLEALGGEDVSDIVTIAHRAALTQSKAAALATIRALQREQQLYAEGAQLLKIRRDYYARYIPHKESRLAMLNETIAERRQNDAANQVAAAALAVEKAKDDARPAEITLLATENQELAELRTSVVADMNLVTKQLNAVEAELRALTEKFDKAKKQDKVDELAAVNGQLLREQQNKLPNLRVLRRSGAQREEVRANVLLQIYSLSDQQSELANVNELADKLAAQLGDLSDDTRAEIRQLLADKQEILGQLVASYEQYSANLAMLHSAESQLIALTDRYSQFIAERVLWIRSCPPLSRADWSPAVDAAKWSLDPLHWNEAGHAMLYAAQQKPGQFSLGVLGLLSLMAIQRRARQTLRACGEEAAKRGCVRLRPTVDALWLTILIALPWPALLAFVGWTMDSLSSSEFVRALGVATKFTAICWLLLELTRHLCRRGGLAAAHFDWSETCLSHLRRRLQWLAIVGLPLVCWSVGLEVQQQQPTSTSSHWSPSLGRVLFIATMLLLAGVLHRMLMAKKSPFRHVVLISGGSWLRPLQITWRPAATLLPAALAILAAVGYYYTAQQSAVRILQTAAMLLAVLTLGGVTRRWLLINRRLLAREQAKQRRAHSQAVAEADADSNAPPTPEPIDDTVDLAALSEQTQTLVRTFLGFTTAVGLVLIWGALLPALAYPASHKLPWAEELTWGGLTTFLLVLAVTYVAVRDIPALLELVILQHLPFDGGSRYAFTSISRYVMTAVGLIIAFKAIGGDWSKIQWLVAAMSVGLGFGLQEIFANFVSGVILLFERPIRVGDIVTLGEKSGVVNRIRMRATTIIDWDRKEYIVPNKDLVTERLLNWTLSDQMNRIEIILFVSHGADTDRACQLLLEAAREQPHVLSEPSPSAVFEGITEAGLKLALRCFLPTLEHRGATIHQLYSNIDRKFRTANIEVASPPREMKVRFLRDQHGHPIPSPHATFPSKSDASAVAKPGKHSAA